MIRVFQSILFGLAVVVLAGCNGSQQNKPIWQDVNIFDLAPSSVSGGRQPLETANFDVYIFEVPSVDVNSLNEIWGGLYSRSLRFNDYDAFEANFFSIGFGQAAMWREISKLLATAGAKKREMISLLLLDGQKGDAPVKWLADEQTVFYFSKAGTMDSVSIGPGWIALSLKADKIIGSRGVCKVTALPVFASVSGSSAGLSKADKKPGDFLFSSVGFALKMSPGDFVILGPREYLSDRITLGSLFFSGAGRKAAVKVYVLFCVGMNY